MVRGYVSEGSGIQPKFVIAGFPNSPSPSSGFVTVTPVTIMQKGTPQRIDREKIIHNVKVTLSVQFLRDAGLEASWLFHHWCNSPEGILWLEGHGITFCSCGPLLRMDDVVSASWERRVSLELKLEHLTNLVPSSPLEYFICVPLHVQGTDRGVIDASE